ncbi:MAG: choice-of-anchor D domain-containing protein, partial [bacterium]|nr:choice-of-anchor D domain-containing protein [bacterium]
MTNSTLEDNEADYLGGGIALDGSQTQALLEGNDIIHNSAPINGGGGISTNNGSSVIHTSGTIAYNTGGFGGGGVRITQAEFVLSGGDIVSNTADSGGGVYMYVDSTSAFTQTGGTIAHNQANNGSGGGIYAYQGDVALIGGQITHNSASYSGGGILVWSANVTMTDTQVVSNSASFSGGGGIYLSQGSATLNMSGGAINNNSTSSTGGGLCVSDGSVTLTGTQVLSNSASSGGGVYTWRGSVTLSGTQVVSNSASSGGGVYVGSLGNAALTGTQVLSNSASSRGGGLYVASGSATLSGVQITDNNAPGGSALYNRGTITPTTALTITGDVYQAGGHFAGSSHDLQVEGALVLAGGDFYAPDAPNELTITGLYTHTGGTYHQTQLVNGSVDVGFPKAGGLILNANGQNLASTTVTLTAGIDCAGVPAGESIEHCYDISPANTTGRDAIATFFYQDGEVPASQYCTAMEAYRWTGAWGIPLTRDTASYGDQGRLCGDDPQSIRVTGVTDFSPFALRGVVPEISVDPSSLDFGDQDVDAGPTVSQTVTITNGGLADLHVTSISLTGNDPSEFVIESGGDAVTLTANSTHTIQVSFDPSITGVMSTNLTIESDDDDEATVDVALAGTGIAPDLTIAKMVDTGGLDPVPLGSVVTYTLVISNGGDGAAFGLVITDPLPAGLNYGTQVDGGTVILPQGNLLSWGPATIPGQSEHVITFTATVTDDVAFAEQDVVNTAYFTATNHVSGASNSVTFTIAAAPVNTPPTISDISNQSTEVSTPISVTFTISDAETALDTLALSADSGNTALVMVGNITFEGSGTDRTATITPTGGMTGTVTITITVDDGEDTAYDAFVLTVTQAPLVNTPPTISDISNQSTEVNTPISVTFTISDAETALDALALSADSGNTALVMVGNITFEGSGTDRTATITPTGGMTGT